MRLSLTGILLACTLGVLPFLPGFGLLSGAISLKTFLLVGIVDLMVIFIAIRLWERKQRAIRVKSPFFLSVVFVLAVQYLAATTGIFFEHSFWGDSFRNTGVFFLSHMALLAVLIGHTLTEDDWSVTRRVLVSTTGVFSLLTIIGVAGLGYTGSVLGQDFSIRGISFGNETYAGIYMVLAALMGTLEYVKTESRKWKVIIASSIVAIALSPILINFSVLLGRVEISEILANPQRLLGLTRSSSVVFYSSAAFLTAWWLVSKISIQSLRRGVKVVMATAAIFGCVLGSVLFLTPGSVVQDAFVQPNTLSRFVMWESAKQGIEDRPYLGWGPENFARPFEAHFNPAHYSTGGRIEVWFDKAHNVVLDTVASSGFLGLISFILLLGAYAFTCYRARARGDIQETELLLLLSFPIVHLMQMQTAFDVVPTYALLAAMGGYVFWLEGKSSKNTFYSEKVRNAVAASLMFFGILSLVVTFAYELPRQASLAESLVSSNIGERQRLIETGLSRVSDLYSLRKTSSVFADGVLQKTADNQDSDTVLSYARMFLPQYLHAYERYLAVDPANYRARVNYAYLLLLMHHWGGENNTEQVLTLVKESETLSPNNPLTSVLYIMATGYAGDFVAAKEELTKMKATFSEIELTNETETWLTTQERMYPQTVFFRLNNI